MTIVVGYTPDESGTAALYLAGMLARSTGDDLVVCSAVAVPWPPSPERPDAEYRELLENAARRALAQARARIPPDLEATYLVHSARSAPTGLLEVAAAHSARLVVLGSSSSGVFGRVSLGSVTDRILHSSHLPVALAPRGFRCAPADRVQRITAAFSLSSNGHTLVQAAAAVAASTGAALRVASFAVSPQTSFAGSIEPGAEDLVISEWVSSTERATTRELTELRSRVEVPASMETVIGRGFSWREAVADIPWKDGDVLTVGSSRTGPAALVFLGSRASKILRHSPVPVVLMPREALSALSEV